MFALRAKPLSCKRCVGVLEASGVVEVVIWRRLNRWRSELHELHCLVLFVTCQQWSLEHRTTASYSNRDGGAENAGQDIAGQDNDGQTGRA